MKSERIELPEGYKQCLLRMLAAGSAWVRCRGTSDLTFSLPPPGVLPLGNLEERTVHWLAESPKAAEFLLALDAAVPNEGTLFQASVVVERLGLAFVRWPAEKLERLQRAGAVVSRGGQA